MMLTVMMMIIIIMTIFRAEGEALAKEWGENVLFFETSAKSDINVKEVILIIVMTIKDVNDKVRPTFGQNAPKIWTKSAKLR